MGTAQRAHGPDDRWRGGVRDVDYLEARLVVGHIGVGAGHGNAEGQVRRVRTAHPMEVITVVDAILGGSRVGGESKAHQQENREARQGQRGGGLSRVRATLYVDASPHSAGS